MRFLNDEEWIQVSAGSVHFENQIYEGALYGALLGMAVGTVNALYVFSASEMILICAYGGFFAGSFLGGAIGYLENQVFNFDQ